MGSVGSDVEVEFQPSTSHCNKNTMPRTQLLVGCGAVKDASVPRKLRSVLKKRARESTTSPMSIFSKKQIHVSNKVDTLKKDSVKKSKLKRGHITKDEEEVAETLYALATMFSDPNKANQPMSNNEPTDTKSPDVLETGSSVNAVEDTAISTQRKETRKIISKFTLEANCHSPSDSKAQFVKLQSPYGSQKPEWSCSKLTSSSPGGSGVESDLPLLHGPRVSTEHAIDLKQVPASGAQYGKNYCPMNDNGNGSIQSPAMGTQSSERRGSCLRIPTWFESTNFVSQPPDITTGKCTRVAVESKRSWRRSSGHVYISCLIKVLQISDNKEGSPEKPAQLMTSGGAHQLKGINGRKTCVSFSDIINSAAEKVSAEFQDRQLVTGISSTLCSPKEGYDFLSLGAEVYGLDANGGINRAGHSDESHKQFHASYLQPQHHPNVLFSLSHNGYSSTFHGHSSALTSEQAQLPQYLSSSANGNFTARIERQLEMQQHQKWANQLGAQYSIKRVGSTHLPDWKSGKTNCGQALFPHLLGSMYQQQHQLMSPTNSSLPLQNVKMNHHHELSSGIERNGPAFYSENMKQLQLPCNHHL